MRTAEKVTRQCACDTLVSTRREKHVKKQGRRKKLKIERGKKKKKKRTKRKQRRE